MSHEPERLYAADAAILDSIRRRVLATDGATVSRIILFGSRARGAARPDSDYDVLGLVRDPSPAERRRYLDALYRAFPGGGAIVGPWVVGEGGVEGREAAIGGHRRPAADFRWLGPTTTATRRVSTWPWGAKA